MNLLEAERIVKAYGEALTAPALRPGVMDARLLPAAPGVIMTAIKLSIAFLIDNGTDNPENTHPLFAAASVLHLFDEAPRSPRERFAASQERDRELKTFVQAVKQFEGDVHGFWPKVFELLALPYEDPMPPLSRMFNSRSPDPRIVKRSFLLSALAAALLICGFAAGWVCRNMQVKSDADKWMWIESRGVPWRDTDSKTLIRMNPVTGETESLRIMATGEDLKEFLWEPVAEAKDVSKRSKRFYQEHQKKQILEKAAAALRDVPEVNGSYKALKQAWDKAKLEYEQAQAGASAE